MKLRPLLIVAVVFVLVVVALGVWRWRHPPEPPPPPLPPLAFSQATDAAKVELKIDPRVVAYPVLAKSLYRDGVAELKAFDRQAAEDQTRLRAKGLPVRPYQRSIAWSLQGWTADLVSVKEDWFDDTGGAHPNHGSKGLLWDPNRDREIARDALIRQGADQSRLDGLLCEAVRAEKARRQRAVFDPQTWPCPKWSDSDFVLARSTQPAKAGGLVFLFDPYSIGPYVEGDWAIVVPQADFHSELAPQWAADFAGRPAA